MKNLAFLIGLFAICTVAIAQENNMLETEIQEQYFQEENQNPDKSIIYVFFNNEPCPNCPQAIDMIEDAEDGRAIDDHMRQDAGVKGICTFYQKAEDEPYHKGVGKLLGIHMQKPE